MKISSARAKRIFRFLDDEIEAVLFINDEEPNLDTMFPYLAGTTSGLFENCLAIAVRDGGVHIVTNTLEETSARASDAEVLVYRNFAERSEQVREILKKVKVVGLNGHGISMSNLDIMKAMLPKVRFVDVSVDLLKAKVVKDKEEQERLRVAGDIVSKVADQIPSIIRPGMTETEAAAELNYHMQKAGASGPSFDSNASFGPNSAEPHHEPDDRRLRKEDIALFDFGALYKKYGSDLTRTFFFGKATAEQKRMYEVVLETQLAGIAAIAPGMKGRDVDAVARRIIDDSEFKGLFIHSLGHSIGLSVHDGVRMAPTSDLVLEEGMVLTVEPGVYIRGRGGVRIEDDIVVTRKGCELLTHAKKDLTVI